MAIIETVATVVAEQLIKEGKMKGEDVLIKLSENDIEEDKKHCAVCEKRIAGNAKFYASQRFVCKVCGHRTHVHCAGDLAGKICAKCQ